MRDGMFGPEGAGLTAVVVGEYTPIAYSLHLGAGGYCQMCAQCAPYAVGEIDHLGNVLSPATWDHVIPATMLTSTTPCQCCEWPYA